MGEAGQPGQARASSGGRERARLGMGGRRRARARQAGGAGALGATHADRGREATMGDAGQVSASTHSTRARRPRLEQAHAHCTTALPAGCSSAGTLTHTGRAATARAHTASAPPLGQGRASMGEHGRARAGAGEYGQARAGPTGPALVPLWEWASIDRARQACGRAGRGGQVWAPQHSRLTLTAHARAGRGRSRHMHTARLHYSRGAALRAHSRTLAVSPPHTRTPLTPPWAPLRARRGSGRGIGQGDPGTSGRACSNGQPTGYPLRRAGRR